mmetsp:Transcript_6485/g.7937  ORF Transcript_6485/g.7937 Transcript_6485/m.7937 type:complete len:90 (-) Transcript_6485:4-273(-)|eukprot:jgi/Bigna1/61334/fgenesh1_kg.20_\
MRYKAEIYGVAAATACPRHLLKGIHRMIMTQQQEIELNYLSSKTKAMIKLNNPIGNTGLSTTIQLAKYYEPLYEMQKTKWRSMCCKMNA